MSHLFRGVGRVFAATSLAALGACSYPQGPPMHQISAEINATLYWLPSTIAAGDSISVRFRRQPDLDQDVPVQLDGTASFLSLTAMPVAGLSLGELDDLLTELYSAFVERPDVTVALSVEAPRTFSVIGEVGQSGQFELPLDRQLTLVEALALAGGHTRATAWMGNLQVIRWIPASGVLQSFVVDARPRHWGTGEPVFIQPWDVLYIPNTNVDQFATHLDNYVRRMIPFPYLIPRDLLF